MNGKNIESWVKNNIPPGFEAAQYLKKLKIMLLLAFLMAQTYWPHFYGSWSCLFYRGILISGRMMPDFVQVLLEQGSPVLGFGLVIVGMLYWMLRFYRSFYRDSKSIYLMKRLPSRWELLRRCTLLPLVGIGLDLLLMVVTIAVFLGLYFLIVPDEAISPHQLAKLLGWMPY